MFETPTTFLLGAGASHHYGYPTGKGLIKEIEKEAQNLLLFLDDCKEFSPGVLPVFVSKNLQDRNNLEQTHIQINSIKTACENLIKRIQVDGSTSIDSFITRNQSLSMICKTLIALVIIKNESSNTENRDYISNPNPPKTERNWLRFVANHIKKGCRHSSDLHKNNVNFVTFNYDLSLETELRKQILCDELFAEEDIDKFLFENRIIHIYGSVDTKNVPIRHEMTTKRFPDPIVHQRFLKYLHLVPIYNRAYTASESLNVINPEERKDQAPHIEIAKAKIRESTKLYILGYGFDKDNNERLDLINAVAASKISKVYFTNFESVKGIFLSAGAFLAGDEDVFEGKTSVYQKPGGPKIKWSDHNVYMALQNDFPFDIP